MSGTKYSFLDTSLRCNLPPSREDNINIHIKSSCFNALFGRQVCVRNHALSKVSNLERMGIVFRCVLCFSPLLLWGFISFRHCRLYHRTAFLWTYISGTDILLPFNARRTANKPSSLSGSRCSTLCNRRFWKRKCVIFMYLNTLTPARCNDLYYGLRWLFLQL
jgi:hypothetical protein